jgi:acetyl-CoA acetyltransferase
MPIRFCPVARRHLWECAACGRQTSVTAGTVMDHTHTPLTLWFWAAYLMATHTPGISAVQLQRQRGISRYETAWLLLHKLRRAMVAPERGLLAGYDHRPVNQHYRLPGRTLILPRAHRVISNLKTWIAGTYHGTSAKHLQVYLDEFTFRHNRRRTPMAAFQTLLSLGTLHGPSTYRHITT